MYVRVYSQKVFRTFYDTLSTLEVFSLRNSHPSTFYEEAYDIYRVGTNALHLSEGISYKVSLDAFPSKPYLVVFVGVKVCTTD